MTQYIERPVNPKTVTAARYVYGQPTDELLRIAQRGDTYAALIEVPDWRNLLIKVGHPDSPDYSVVADGAWLVYSEDRYTLIVLDDDEFTATYEPPPAPGLIHAVASAIFKHQHEDPTEIAQAALNAADRWRQQEADHG